MKSSVWTLAAKDLHVFFKNSFLYTLCGFCGFIWGIFFSFKFLIFLSQSPLPSASPPLEFNAPVSGLNIDLYLVGDYINFVHYTLLLVICLLSPLFFAEEKKMNTFSLLLFTPLNSWQLVWAKGLFGALVLTALLALSSILPLSLLLFSKISFFLLVTHYFGAFLIVITALFFALLSSSLTQSSLGSTFLSLLFVVFFILMDGGGNFLKNSLGGEWAGSLYFEHHYSFFKNGVLPLSSVLFFVSSWAPVAFATERVIESHRWR